MFFSAALAEDGATAAFLRAIRTMQAQEAQSAVHAPQDPVNPGQRLSFYSFGSVLERIGDEEPCLEICLTTPQTVDPRDVYVGMTLEEAGLSLTEGRAPLTVLQVDEGIVWCYRRRNTLCGIEWLMHEDGVLTTLTYLTRGERIETIRLRQTPMTRDAWQALLTHARRLPQEGEAPEWGLDPIPAGAFTLNDRAILGQPVDVLISAIAEPLDIQGLPGGRWLLYDGAAVLVGLEEVSGREVIEQIVVTEDGMLGPRGIRVGMSLEEFALCFSGKMSRRAQQVIVRESNGQGMLCVQFQEGILAAWQIQGGKD